jgi:CheY-like chemotaxis protein
VGPPLKKKGRILLVDNDKRTSYIISLILKLNGYDVEYYADPKSMLSQLQGNAYDLILMAVRVTTIIMMTTLYNHLKEI